MNDYIKGIITGIIGIVLVFLLMGSGGTSKYQVVVAEDLKNDKYPQGSLLNTETGTVLYLNGDEGTPVKF